MKNGWDGVSGLDSGLLPESWQRSVSKRRRGGPTCLLLLQRDVLAWVLLRCRQNGGATTVSNYLWFPATSNTTPSFLHWTHQLMTLLPSTRIHHIFKTYAFLSTLSAHWSSSSLPVIAWSSPRTSTRTPRILGWRAWFATAENRTARPSTTCCTRSPLG